MGIMGKVYHIATASTTSDSITTPEILSNFFAFTAGV